MLISWKAFTRDREVKLIDQAKSVDDLRRRECCWQHEVDTSQTKGLNKHEVVVF